MVPPNVYYLEVPFEGRRLRAKYAVVSLPALARDCSKEALVPTLWARMAQPCALVGARDAGVRRRVRDSLVAAVETTAAETLPLLPAAFTPRELWTEAFRQSYRTEFRAERAGRPEQLYAAAAARYDGLTAAALGDRARQADAAGGTIRLEHAADAGSRRRAERRWWRRRLAGRTLHLLRLVKNAYTFADGLDYVLWKIEQHSGIRTEPTPWQRRHPLLAAPGLAWRLYRQGAFR